MLCQKVYLGGILMLIEADRSILLIIDVQKKLIPAIHLNEGLVEQILILQKSANELDIPMIITEQYPKGLGSTLDKIKLAQEVSRPTISKLTFSAMGEDSFKKELNGLLSNGRDQVIVCGVETHICVMQTSLDLINEKVNVFAVIDAVGSRTPENRDAGLSRMATYGAHCVTSEMVIFEWLKICGTPSFKLLSKLIT